MAGSSTCVDNRHSVVTRHLLSLLVSGDPACYFLLRVPGIFAQRCAREGRKGGFDVDKNKADSRGGDGRVDCIWRRSRDGRFDGAYEKGDPRGQAGSARHCDEDSARHRSTSRGGRGQVGPEWREGRLVLTAARR
jgi:hypothetical protein